MADDRLHLQHGPIDLILHVEASESIRKRLYSAVGKRFHTVLEELVTEMELLKLPWNSNQSEPKGSIAQKMFGAVSDSTVFLTPMVAVAGAVADEMLETMILEAQIPDSCLEHISRVYVNNGGDIAFWLNSGELFSIGVVDNPEIPKLNTKVNLAYESPVRGIATSGWRGRSLSLGIADAVTVLAKSATDADVAATLIANEVNVDFPGIEKRPASEVKDESDLGMIPVTVHVPDLPEDKIFLALEQGAKTARRFIKAEKITAAYLSLQKQRIIIDNKSLLP
jgi:ApbE superfamily uncharacterized protein (UPF0280 family)